MDIWIWFMYQLNRYHVTCLIGVTFIFCYIIRANICFWDLRDGFLRKCFPSQHKELSLISPKPKLKRQAWWHKSVLPVLERKRQEDPWGSQASQHRYVWQVTGQWEILSHKTRLKASKKLYLRLSFDLYVYICVCVYICTIKYICTDMHAHMHIQMNILRIKENIFQNKILGSKI